ncbi:radical SAM protein [Candidatus Dojkabacteria bacterium]|nr:radical SAM protein [Candidatus Dojkabacteria bacterium]
MYKEITAKSLLSSSTKPDSWFGTKYNMNLYRGCEHQCIYCDSRSECYKIDDFNNTEVKINAAELLQKELKSKRIKGTIGFGAMSDTYAPVEARYKLTRKCLEIIAALKFPIHILTKSALVVRDLDLIKSISSEFAAISFTLTTADDTLAKIVEPKAALSSARFSAMKKLAKAGIYTGITMMPVLPFLEDNLNNISAIVESAAESGASYIIPAFGMTLRGRQREYYYQKLDESFPGMKMRYVKKFGNSYSCGVDNYRLLRDRFEELCHRYGIVTRIDIYEPVSVFDSEQGKLFD